MKKAEEKLRECRTNEVVGRRMDFSSDANANFEGLLEVNREICMPQMAEKTSPDPLPNCAVAPSIFSATSHRKGKSCDHKPQNVLRGGSFAIYGRPISNRKRSPDIRLQYSWLRRHGGIASSVQSAMSFRLFENHKTVCREKSGRPLAHDAYFASARSMTAGSFSRMRSAMACMPRSPG